jgi:hypothetical protein
MGDGDSRVNLTFTVCRGRWRRKLFGERTLHIIRLIPHATMYAVAWRPSRTLCGKSYDHDAWRPPDGCMMDQLLGLVTCQTCLDEYADLIALALSDDWMDVT